MTRTILITYATRTGFTPGVAEAIARTLTENGLHVEVLPMQQVKDLAPYAAVVAGSAIQDKRWLPEAIAFLETHRSALQAKPFAAFLVCMTLTIGGGMYREHVKEFMAPVRRLVRPAREGYFAGGLDIRKVPTLANRIMFRLSVLLGVWKEGDHRDWDAIRQWTLELLPLFQPLKG